MNFSRIGAVILAAGKSTRFKTKKSKLLFSICGRPMIMYSIKVLEDLGFSITLVLGHQADQIQALREIEPVKNLSFVIQKEQLGTAHAVACAADKWSLYDNILIMNGDMPLITKELIEEAIEKHLQSCAVLTFLSTLVLDPTSYGRVVVLDGQYSVVEEKDCTFEQRQINKINAGIYVVNRKWLEENINRIQKSPSGEYYLPDLILMASKQGVVVKEVPVAYDYVRGVNNMQELWTAEQIKRSEFIKYWMSEGVRFELAQSIHIEIDVKIGPGSFIGTGAHLLGKTEIGEGCFVGAFSIIENTKIGDETTIHSHSVIQDSEIGKNVHIGPFARLRHNVQIGNNVEVGNFVEIKNTQIGDNTKTKHLSYLGDAVIGSSVNIGAGTITCNYDGVNKYKTEIEDEAFIGSNNTLIAPLKIGKGAYTAGGSTISQDVPEGSLGIGRSRQENKIGYVQKLKSKKKDNSLDDLEKDVEENIKFNFMGAVKSDTDKQQNL
jgi:bifunctional UDP-N-acetylglucosamine pyrophosphorylase/glucosamine-1-phosphate N-acetyltransferase